MAVISSKDEWKVTKPDGTILEGEGPLPPTLWRGDIIEMKTTLVTSVDDWRPANERTGP